MSPGPRNAIVVGDERPLTTRSAVSVGSFRTICPDAGMAKENPNRADQPNSRDRVIDTLLSAVAAGH
jgi:hypothetical protein